MMQNKGSCHLIKIKTTPLMRYYIITGEHSGDIHGADLIIHLKQADPKADFWSCGGVAMAQAMGKPPTIEASKMGYIGLDFLKSIYTLWKRLRFCKQSLIEYHPDVVILIDYSGFNMRLADFAKKRGYRIYYYIPPKIWAHHPKRIEQIKKNVAKVLSILPFEVAYYQNSGYDTIDYVGNPLVQKVATHRVNATFLTDNGLPDKPIIALLPGSRLDEVERILPYIMVQGSELEAYQLVVAGLSHMPSQVYQKLLLPHVKIIYDQTYDLLHFAQMGIIASGTASLEAALFNLPQIVVYKTHPLTYLFYKNIIMVKHISLVNLLAGDRSIIPEFIQGQLTQQNCYNALTNLRAQGGKQHAMYKLIKTVLGKKNAAKTAAEIILASHQK